MDELKDNIDLNEMSGFNHVLFNALNTFNHGMECRIIAQIKEELRFKRGCYGSDLGKKSDQDLH